MGFKRTGVWLSVLAAASMSAQTYAAESFGVQVYPGASPDPETTKVLKESIIKAECASYRTNDSVGKVASFYEKQPGMTPMGQITKEGGMFQRCKKAEYNPIFKQKMGVGCDRDVTIQSPWRDMKSGKMMNDTLITIVEKNSLNR